MDTDRRTVLTVVILLGLIALGALACGTFLTQQGKADAAIAIAVFGQSATCIGALGAILAHTGSGVVQVQPATALVPVTEPPAGTPVPAGPPAAEVAA